MWRWNDSSDDEPRAQRYTGRLDSALGQPSRLGVQLHTGWILDAMEVTPLLSPNCLDAAAVLEGDAQGVAPSVAVEASHQVPDV